MENSIRALSEAIDGEVLAPGDEGYDQARTVWNGRFDPRPAAIARCTGPNDVAAALHVARRHQLPVSVRSGGHDYAGKSVCDHGLTIDLSRWKAIDIDPGAMSATVQPGVRWGEFDSKTQQSGLATTGATVSTVGVAGFTLGGGSGWLSRKHGLALDNLRAAEVVLASGEVVRASERENEDLFWAIRGGSGNFGVVTSFEYRLHRVGPTVLGGQILHPLESAPESLRLFRSFISEAPDEVQIYPFFFRVPPLDAFPDEWHGRVAIDLVVGYMGDVSEGEKILEPVLRFGRPFFHAVGPLSYATMQRSFDAGMPGGMRWYSKAHDLRELSDAAIDTIVRNVEELPGAFTVVYLEPKGGAIGRVDREATAFPHRDAPCSIHILPGWQNAAEDEEMIGWARRFHGEMSRFATGGIYVNLVDGDEGDVGRAAYGTNYEKLRRVKQKFDPTNLFRQNQNITPAV